MELALKDRGTSILSIYLAIILNMENEKDITYKDEVKMDPSNFRPISKARPI